MARAVKTCRDRTGRVVDLVGLDDAGLTSSFEASLPVEIRVCGLRTVVDGRSSLRERRKCERE
jgi:hypothetical protein